MKAFILNDSVKSFLCLNNKLPQENKGLFDIKLLEDFADAIIKLYDIKGLKGKKKYYVRVCSYKKVSGKKVQGAYSVVKGVKTKK